jgi:hypothetical protein
MRLEVLRLVAAADPDALFAMLWEEPREAERARALEGLLNQWPPEDPQFGRLLLAARLPSKILKKVLKTAGMPPAYTRLVGVARLARQRLGLGIP